MIGRIFLVQLGTSSERAHWRRWPLHIFALWTGSGGNAHVTAQHIRVTQMACNMKRDLCKETENRDVEIIGSAHQISSNIDFCFSILGLFLQRFLFLFDAHCR